MHSSVSARLLQTQLRRATFLGRSAFPATFRSWRTLDSAISDAVRVSRETRSKLGKFPASSGQARMSPVLDRAKGTSESIVRCPSQDGETLLLRFRQRTDLRVRQPQ